MNYNNIDESLEVWRDIKGYEGYYQVSNYGRVKSVERTRKSKNNSISIVREKILKLKSDKDGYLEVALTKNSKTKFFRAHRLVAEAFILNPNNYPIINHKNEVKYDNRVENLEWCTYEYNRNYGSNFFSRTKLVGQYDTNMKLIKVFKGAKKADKELNYYPSSVSKCCLGVIKHIGEYTFKYISNNKEEV